MQQYKNNTKIIQSPLLGTLYFGFFAVLSVLLVFVLGFFKLYYCL